MLADTRVPLFYVLFVIYHECLHAHLGPASDKHGELFRMFEGRFLQIADVHAWERSTETKPWPPAPKGIR